MGYKYENQVTSRLLSMSRYRESRIITDTTTREKFLESYERKEIPVSQNDTYHQVKPEEEGRLDLIAYRFYRSPLLWWVIASANDISNPLVEPAVGDTLRIPPITSLYGNNGILL